MADQNDSSDQNSSSTKLAEIAEIFHLLGADCEKNIGIIVEQTCRILNGTCSLYNRIDDKTKSLIVWSGHARPEDFDERFEKQGHICWEATIKGKDKPVILPDLESTVYFTTDPYVQKYNLKSYLGFPVRLKDSTIGSLCIVDTKKRTFANDEIHIIQMLAAALSLEEERLHEEERYRILVESSNDAIYIIQDGILKFFNPKAVKLTGYSAEQLGLLHFSELIHPGDREWISQNHIRRLKGEKFQSTYAFRLINADGHTVWVQINAVQIMWEGRPAVLGCLRDISRLKELEEKLVRAEKMELIGTMAGGVAHDLNNILSGLVSYPELVLMQLPENSPLREPITFMHDAGLRAADIVQDLLTLTRRGIPNQKVINLNTLIRDYFNSAAHRRLEQNSPNIRFVTEFEPELLNISGSPSHISKIIMNLMFNAAESIKKEGMVGIKTHNQYIDLPLAGYDTIEEGDYVVLSVSDNGGGIAQEDLNRIFEPFYTKKQMGRSGSGLGLSVVWNCVKDHNGYIEIKSHPNRGTLFEIFLPATREDDGLDSEDFVLEDFAGCGETILVVDDVEEQRKIAADALKVLGYTPFCVASGEKAIAFTRTQKVDLILLDMKMEPGIDGLETYTEIIRHYPGQKAVIASGFSESDRVKETLRLGAGQYIRKPYTLKKLAVALNEELSRPG
jgi:PAS domain S-box-containing protein